MTADVELPTLPEWAACDETVADMSTTDVRDAMNDHARACVAHATAAKDAEIEALRAEVAAVWNAMPSGTRYLDPPDGGDVPLHEQVRRMAADAARAERLAEALRDLEVCANSADRCYSRMPGNFAVALQELRHSAERARAALHNHEQEKQNEQ